MPYRIQMNPNLMRSSRERLNGHERVRPPSFVPEYLNKAVFRFRFLYERIAFPPDRMPNRPSHEADRLIDNARIFLRDSHNEREVTFFNFVMLKKFFCVLKRTLTPGNDENAGRVAVETMNDPWAHFRIISYVPYIGIAFKKPMNERLLIFMAAHAVD
jgi:hypothetical protein